METGVSDVVQIAIRPGQFWRSNDGTEGVLIVSVNGDTIQCEGMYISFAYGTARVHEGQFRRDFPFLLFQPTPDADDADPA